MNFSVELAKLAEKLEENATHLSEEAISQPLLAIEKVANEFSKAWSGSNLGYHANIYYKDFSLPPPGVHFDIEWGNTDNYPVSVHDRNWVEYNSDDIIREIKRRAGVQDLELLRITEQQGRKIIDQLHPLVLSILSRIQSENPHDIFLKEWVQKAKNISVRTLEEFEEELKPTLRLMTRDTVAAQGGFVLPPHLHALANVMAVRCPYVESQKLAKILRTISFHLHQPENQSRETTGQNMKQNKRIFIGHGQSFVWKDLQDFLQNRLKLEWDEFNRIPTAGTSTIERLKQMLNDAAFAFLVLTAEDQQSNETTRARQNVIHEAGLFQGKLGFDRAIILLEEGCEEFSNINGLVQIRFPKGNISAKFEEIRRVLEYQKIIEGHTIEGGK